MPETAITEAEYSKLEPHSMDVVIASQPARRFSIHRLEDEIQQPQTDFGTIINDFWKALEVALQDWGLVPRELAYAQVSACPQNGIKLNLSWRDVEPEEFERICNLCGGLTPNSRGQYER